MKGSVEKNPPKLSSEQRQQKIRQARYKQNLQHVRPSCQLPPSGGYVPGLLGCSRDGGRCEHHAVQPEQRENGLRGAGVSPHRHHGGRAARS